MNVEAVAPNQCLSRLQIRLNFALVHTSLCLVGKQDLDDVGFGRSVGGAHGVETMFLRHFVIPRAWQFGHNDLDAAVAHVLSLRVTLAAVTDNGDSLILQDAQVGILVVVHFNHGRRNPYRCWGI